MCERERNREDTTTVYVAPANASPNRPCPQVKILQEIANGTFASADKAGKGVAEISALQATDHNPNPNPNLQATKLNHSPDPDPNTGSDALFSAAFCERI